MASFAMLLAQGACGGDDEGSGGSGGTSTTTTTTTTTTMTTTSGTGGTPITCTATYSEVPAGECDLLQQDCPIGTGCVPVQNGADWTTACMPGAGLKQAGQDCTGTTQCAPGLECIFAKCSPVCCPDTNMAPCEGGLCNVVLDYGAYEVQYCSYLELCELFDPSTCNNGLDGYCYPLFGMGYAACAPPVNPVGDLEPCTSLNQCPNNSVCYDDQCRYACLLDNWMTLQPGEGGCAANTTCLDLGVGLPNVGLCSPQ